MIGLGSNRLTVCRRGGMSVTQAGKGGMEWLAGTGSRSPYSAQAAAALKAQFPTQWPTIAEYGRNPANAAYINAINLFAPEDPLIMYSLIPSLGKRRWLEANGKEYINSGFIFTQRKLRYEFRYRKRQNLNLSSHGVDYSSSPRRLHGLLWGSAFFVGSSNWGISQALNTWYDTTIRITDSASYLKLNTTEYNFGISDWNGCSDPDFLFAGNRAGSPVYMAYMDVEFWQFFDHNDAMVRYFIPCKHMVEGVEKSGFLDLVEAKWYGNANSSGSFTISETPAS